MRRDFLKRLMAVLALPFAGLLAKPASAAVDPISVVTAGIDVQRDCIWAEYEVMRSRPGGGPIRGVDF